MGAGDLPPGPDAEAAQPPGRGSTRRTSDGTAGTGTEARLRGSVGTLHGVPEGLVWRAARRGRARRPPGQRNERVGDLTVQVPRPAGYLGEDTVADHLRVREAVSSGTRIRVAPPRPSGGRGRRLFLLEWPASLRTRSRCGDAGPSPACVPRRRAVVRPPAAPGGAAGSFRGRGGGRGGVRLRRPGYRGARRSPPTGRGRCGRWRSSGRRGSRSRARRRWPEGGWRRTR